MQYNTTHNMSCNVIPCKAVQYDTAPYSKINYNSVQYSKKIYCTIEYNSIQNI